MMMMMMMIFLRYVTAGRKREREKYQSRRYIAHQRSAIQFCNWLTSVKHSITPPCVFCRVKNFSAASPTIASFPNALHVKLSTVPEKSIACPYRANFSTCQYRSRDT